MKRLWVILVSLLLSLSCYAYQSVTKEQIRSANVRVVSHPKLVEGLTFVNGYTNNVGSIYGISEIQRMVTQSLVHNGYRDVVVHVEILDAGIVGYKATTVRVSIYK